MAGQFVQLVSPGTQIAHARPVVGQPLRIALLHQPLVRLIGLPQAVERLLEVQRADLLLEPFGIHEHAVDISTLHVVALMADVSEVPQLYVELLRRLALRRVRRM